MPSLAYNAFIVAAQKAKILRNSIRITRTRLSEYDKNVYLHASLAAYVAAWDSYANNLIREFFDITANSLDSKYSTIHNILALNADSKLTKFNTPNFENSRALFVTSTGYDPINDWHWPSRRWSRIQVQTRLNEILRVRHSFAHGFSMPTYQWNQSRTGATRLTAKIIDETHAFFSNLVQRTDQGMKSYITISFSISSFW